MHFRLRGTAPAALLVVRGAARRHRGSGRLPHRSGPSGDAHGDRQTADAGRPAHGRRGDCGVAPAAAGAGGGRARAGAAVRRDCSTSKGQSRSPASGDHPTLPGTDPRNDSTAGDSDPSPVHSASPYVGAGRASSRNLHPRKAQPADARRRDRHPHPRRHQADRRLPRSGLLHDGERHAGVLTVADHPIVHVGRGPPDHGHEGPLGQVAQANRPGLRQRVIARHAPRRTARSIRGGCGVPARSPAG